MTIPTQEHTPHTQTQTHTQNTTCKAQQATRQTPHAHADTPAHIHTHTRTHKKTYVHDHTLTKLLVQLVLPTFRARIPPAHDCKFNLDILHTHSNVKSHQSARSAPRGLQSTQAPTHADCSPRRLQSTQIAIHADCTPDCGPLRLQSTQTAIYADCNMHNSHSKSCKLQKAKCKSLQIVANCCKLRSPCHRFTHALKIYAHHNPCTLQLNTIERSLQFLRVAQLHDLTPPWNLPIPCTTLSVQLALHSCTPQ